MNAVVRESCEKCTRIEASSRLVRVLLLCGAFLVLSDFAVANGDALSIANDRVANEPGAQLIFSESYADGSSVAVIQHPDGAATQGGFQFPMYDQSRIFGAMGVGIDQERVVAKQFSREDFLVKGYDCVIPQVDFISVTVGETNLFATDQKFDLLLHPYTDTGAIPDLRDVTAVVHDQFVPIRYDNEKYPPVIFHGTHHLPNDVYKSGLNNTNGNPFYLMPLVYSPEKLQEAKDYLVNNPTVEGFWVEMRLRSASQAFGGVVFALYDTYQQTSSFTHEPARNSYFHFDGQTDPTTFFGGGEFSYIASGAVFRTTAESDEVTISQDAVTKAWTYTVYPTKAGTVIDLNETTDLLTSTTTASVHAPGAGLCEVIHVYPPKTRNFIVFDRGTVVASSP